MQNSKLIGYLKSLSKAEIKSFQLFLASPYFNQNPHLIRLMKYLGKYHPIFSARKVERTHVFQIVYPNEQYSEGKINILMSGMNKCLEMFFSIENCRQDDFEVKKNRISFFKKKGLYQPLSRHLKKLKADLDIEMEKGEDRLFEQMVVAKENAFYATEGESMTVRGQKISTFRLNLDEFYLKERLRLACLEVNHNEIFGIKKHSNLQDALLMEFADVIQTNPVLQFYQQFLTLQEEFDAKLLIKMVDNFLEAFDKFLPLEQKSLMVLLLNKIFQGFRMSQSSLLPLAMKLYNIGLKERLFEEGGYLPEITFTNIAIIAIGNNQFDWVDEFIEEYVDRLKEEKQEHAKFLAYGTLHFKKAQLGDKEKHFKLAKKYLEPLDQNKLFDDVRVRSLLLRIYYEEFDNLDDLENYIAAFEMKMKRAQFKLSQKKIKAFLGFIRVTKKLTALSSDLEIPTDVIENLEKNVKSNKNIALKSWLIDKIEELKKG